MSLKYAYCRISTTDQNIDRQIIAVKQFAPDISDNNIFVDKKTGKDFEREQYQEMKVILEHISKASLKNEPIELIVEELDRLGRNADLIKKELMWFKEHNIIVRILEIPTTLHEVDESNRWVTEMVTNLLIEVYAQLAQVELEKRAKRQAEGIAIAKSKGVYKGRKPIQIDNEQFVISYTRWKANEITARQAMLELNIKANTFYRRVKEYETNKKAISNT
ncbi:recombinase family protein [Roseburia sp.]|uniref:recombinase family protein n=1 Tax=Roseburia sp. TaxID=2049040 RepID=UPI003522A154